MASVTKTDSKLNEMLNTKLEPMTFSKIIANKREVKNPITNPIKTAPLNKITFSIAINRKISPFDILINRYSPISLLRRFIKVSDIFVTYPFWHFHFLKGIELRPSFHSQLPIANIALSPNNRPLA